MTDRLVLGVFLCDGRPQVSLTSQDENGTADGYRLLGPSFIGTSELLQNKILDQGDAAEIRRMLDAVFPQTLSQSQRAEVEHVRRELDEGWGVGNIATAALLAIVDQAFPRRQVTP